MSITRLTVVNDKLAYCEVLVFYIEDTFISFYQNLTNIMCNEYLYGM